MGKLAPLAILLLALATPASAQNQPTAKVSTLIPATTPLTGPELFYVVQGGVSKSVSFSAFRSQVSGIQTGVIGNFPVYTGPSTLGPLSLSGAGVIGATGAGLAGILTPTQLTAILNPATTSLPGVVQPDGTTILDSAGVISAASTTINGVPCTPGSSCAITAAAAAIIAGTTTVTGGPGVLSNATSGGVLVSSTTLPSGLTAPSLTATTAFTATGLVTNADLVNPSLTIGSTNVALGGTQTTFAGLSSVTSTTFVGSLTGGASLDLPLAGGALTGALTYGGVTLANSATGTGSMVLSTSPTILNPVFSGLTGPLLGNGSSAVTAGTISGSTHVFLTADGALISGHCPQIDGSGGLIDSGAACGGGSGGSGTVAAGLTNNLGVYTTSGTTISPLATANNGVLVTSSGGAPSIGSTLPAAVQGAITSLGTIASGVWQGTVIAAAYLPTATTGALGVVEIGTGLSVSAGVVTPTFGTAANQVAAGGVISAAGPIGSATTAPIITYNAAGQLTTVGSAVVTPSAASITAGALASSVTINNTNWSGTGLANANLANPSVTVNGVTCTLGSTCSITAVSITPGTTTIISGTTNGLLYDNAGTLGNLASADNGVLVTSSGGVPSISTTLPSGLMAPSLTVTTAFTATGLVTNADLANPSLTVGSTNIALGVTQTALAGLTSVASTTFVGALTGHASLDCALAGCVIAGASSVAGLTVTSSLTATGLVTNADLVNSATTVNGVACTLGSTCTITAATTSLVAGTTTVTGGPGVLSNATSGGVLVSSLTLPSGLTAPNMTLAPTASTLGQGLIVNQTAAGTQSSPPYYANPVTINFDAVVSAVNPSFGNSIYGLGPNCNLTSASLNGYATCSYSQMSINAAGFGLGPTTSNFSQITTTVSAPVIAISSVSYNSGTGLVTLGLASPTGLTPIAGDYVAVFGVTGTGSFNSVNGAYAVVSASGSTLTYTIPTGLTLTATGGNVSPNTFVVAGNDNATINSGNTGYQTLGGREFDVTPNEAVPTVFGLRVANAGNHHGSVEDAAIDTISAGGSFNDLIFVYPGSIANNIINSPNIKIAANGTITSNSVVLGQSGGFGAIFTGSHTSYNPIEFVDTGSGGQTWYLGPGAGTATTSFNLYNLTGTIVALGVGPTGSIAMPSLASSSAATTGTVCWTTGTGNLTVDTTLACLASLEELKDIRAPISGTEALNEIGQLRPVWGTWRRDSPEYTGDAAEQPFLTAHQVESVDPRLVGYGTDGTLRGVRYMEMSAVLVAAVKELKANNDNLVREVAELRRRVN